MVFEPHPTSSRIQMKNDKCICCEPWRSCRVLSFDTSGHCIARSLVQFRTDPPTLRQTHASLTNSSTLYQNIHRQLPSLTHQNNRHDEPSQTNSQPRLTSTKFFPILSTCSNIYQFSFSKTQKNHVLRILPAGFHSFSKRLSKFFKMLQIYVDVATPPFRTSLRTPESPAPRFHRVTASMTQDGVKHHEVTIR